jgi:hypothetical protein
MTRKIVKLLRPYAGSLSIALIAVLGQGVTGLFTALANQNRLRQHKRFEAVARMVARPSSG